MRPFRPKLPENISNYHLAIAGAIKALNSTSTEDKPIWEMNYNHVKEVVGEIDCTAEDENSIRKALHYLNADEYAMEDISDFCSRRRQEIEWQVKDKKWQEERRLGEEEEQKREKKYEEEIKRWDLEGE